MTLPTRRFLWCLGMFGALIVVGSSHASVTDPQTTWYGTYMNGRKIGFMSLTSETVNENGRNRVRLTTTSTVDLTMMGTSIRQDSTVVSLCDASMRPLRQEYTIVSGGSTMRLTAAYEQTVIRCVVEAGGSPSSKNVPIPKGAVLTADSSFIGVGQTPKVGTTTTLHYLNPLTVTLEKVMVKVEASGKVRLGDAEYDAIRVAATTPLGPIISWQTAGGDLLWAKLPLGMAMYRMTEAAATDRGTPEPTTSEGVAEREEVPEDFATATAIVPDRPIPNPRGVRRLTVDVSGIPDDYTPISDYWQTARKLSVPEAAQNETGHVFRFAVTSVARPKPARGSTKLPAGAARYARPGPYLDQDRPEIRNLARKLRDPKGNPAVTAARIRAWIHRNMTPDFGIGVPRSAVDVLKRKRGVCRDYATLFAALGRAAGVPTRVASGIVYGDGRFYYHAWVECWLGGWVPFDATLPTDFVDATHIKFAHGDPTDMMDVARVIGKLSIRVVDVRP